MERTSENVPMKSSWLETHRNCNCTRGCWRKEVKPYSEKAGPGIVAGKEKEMHFRKLLELVIVKTYLFLIPAQSGLNPWRNNQFGDTDAFRRLSGFQE